MVMFHLAMAETQNSSTKISKSTEVQQQMQNVMQICSFGHCGSLMLLGFCWQMNSMFLLHSKCIMRSIYFKSTRLSSVPLQCRRSRLGLLSRPQPPPSPQTTSGPCWGPTRPQWSHWQLVPGGRRIEQIKPKVWIQMLHFWINIVNLNI